VAESLASRLASFNPEMHRSVSLSIDIPHDPIFTATRRIAVGSNRSASNSRRLRHPADRAGKFFFENILFQFFSEHAARFIVALPAKKRLPTRRGFGLVAINNFGDGVRPPRSAERHW